MSLRSKRPSTAPEAKDNEPKTPASGFFDNFELSDAPVINQRQWREDTGTPTTPKVIETAPEAPALRGKIEGGNPRPENCCCSRLLIPR
jgi:hypothetical protein